MDTESFYSTRDVSAMFSKNIAAVLKYARSTSSIRREGNGKSTRYYWTQKDIESYKKYLEDVKNHTNYKIPHKYKETDKIDTLYKRLNRAIKKNNQELISAIRKDIEEFKKNNS